MEFEKIVELIEIINKSSLNSLEIEMESMKIKMSKEKEVIEWPITTYKTENSKDVESYHSKGPLSVEKEVQEDENIKTITSPILGTFYASPSPGEKSFVQVGDVVKKGQLLCIVEAMKLMNDIESEWDGTIVEVCVENEQILEYNQPLFKIKV